jgi:hypothetical protein
MSVLLHPLNGLIVTALSFAFVPWLWLILVL